MKNALFLSALLSMVACATSPREETAGAPTGAQPPTSAAPSRVVAGYAHDFSRSKFHIGSGVNHVRLGEADVLVGSDGTFTTRASGAIFAVPNAVSPAAAAPPLTKDAAAHNAAVKAYFIGAGISEDQIDVILVRSTMRDSGPISLAVPHPTFVGYTSVLTRKIDGYKVMDSEASARINANGEVVAEHVYWPDIPAQVIDDARALDAVVHDTRRARTFFASLPTEQTEGEVVIRHNSAVEDAPFVVQASYDVRATNGKARHFDISGKEILLPQETRAAFESSRR